MNWKTIIIVALVALALYFVIEATSSAAESVSSTINSITSIPSNIDQSLSNTFAPNSDGSPSTNQTILGWLGAAAIVVAIAL